MDDVRKYTRRIAEKLTSGKKEPDFFETVRNFELRSPQKPRVGYSHHTSSDILQFGQLPHLAFPETAMHSIRDTASGKPFLDVLFFGMLGGNGPMPMVISQYVLERSKKHYDSTWQRFLDIFNHRFLSLFYRAWAQNHLIVSSDRPEEDTYSSMFRALSGAPEILNQAGWKRITTVMAAYSVYFSAGSKVRESLQELLSLYFRMPITVETKVLAQYPLPPDCRFRLGCHQTALLGKNSQIGRKYTSISKKIRFLIGPVTFQQYQTLLPGTENFLHFCILASTLLNQPLLHDMEFQIKTYTIPRLTLNHGLAMGNSFWLGKAPAPQTTVRIHSYSIFARMHRNSQTSI